MTIRLSVLIFATIDNFFINGLYAIVYVSYYILLLSNKIRCTIMILYKLRIKNYTKIIHIFLWCLINFRVKSATLQNV